MGFTDLMTSAKGPGLVGILLALLVVAGFGALALLALEDGGPLRESIDKVIARQANEIEGLQETVKRRESSLQSAMKRVEDAETIAKAKAATAANKTRVDALRGDLEAADKALSAQRDVFEQYKDAYRNYIRAQYRGRRMDSLKTLDGKTYQNVSIRRISPIGLQISHDDGLTGVDYEVLPHDLQDVLQFSPEQKQAALAAAEEASRSAHNAAVNEQKRLHDESVKKKKEQQKALVENAEQALPRLQAQVRKLRTDIKLLNKELMIENARRKGLSKAPQIRQRLNAKQAELDRVSLRIEKCLELLNH